MVHETARSADGVLLVSNMVVWCNNTVVGYPPIKHIVGSVGTRKFLYADNNPGEYAGCKADCAWVSLTKALAHAILVGDGE
jgi:hypothetical protein